MADRFRGFLPVVVDVETGGFNAKTDALLEIAAVLLTFDDGGKLRRDETYRYHVKPFDVSEMRNLLDITLTYWGRLVRRRPGDLTRWEPAPSSETPGD